MNQYSIHPDTRLGNVHLTVSDLERSTAFYKRSLGFQVHRTEGDTAYLGAGRDDLLVLKEQIGSTLVPQRTGLYHFAILTPSRLDLAKSLRNLIQTETNIDGGSNHLVSEALYLSDPDGNGIEIYRDLPRSTWRFDDGLIEMGTMPLDFQGVLAELGEESEPWMGLHHETVLGHMHLHVSDLQEAEDFYKNVIGFDTMISIGGSASFLSAGGYHHHLGINIWNGVGVPPPPPDSVGLRYFVVHLPNKDEEVKLVERLKDAKAPFEEKENGLLVKDPSQNAVLFTVS